MTHCDGSCSDHLLVLELLRPGPAARAGVDLEHVEALAEVVDRWPPLLVHCPSRRLIDGQHRLAAARRVGVESLPVAWWHGEPELLFGIAVGRNATHGLTLNRAERRAAVEVLLRTDPTSSDRAIARCCAVSPTTVGTVRRALTARQDPCDGDTAEPAPSPGPTPAGRTDQTDADGQDGDGTAHTRKGWRMAWRRWWQGLIARLRSWTRSR
jgi:hypothetical protein